MSNNVRSLFKSHLVPKMKYEGGRAAPEGDMVKLSSNENPLGPSPRAMGAMMAAIPRLNRYPDQTDFRLREALARFFEGRLDAWQFIGGPSGSELIDLILRAFLRRGDEVIISNPSFLPYTVFSGWYEAKVVDVPLTAADYTLDVDAILAAVNPATRIVFLTSPNNPTGTYIPESTLRMLLEGLPDNVLVVFDEVYAAFADASDYTTALPFVEEGFPIVGLQSFSKLYGLAGVRLGYAYTTREIADYIRLICKPFLLPQLAIEAGMAALEDTEFVERSVHVVHRERRRMEDFFTAQDIRFWPSQGNFVLIDPPMPEGEFVDKLLDHGIMVRAMEAFGAPGKVRISVGIDEHTDRLFDAIRGMNPQP